MRYRPLLEELENRLTPSTYAADSAAFDAMYTASLPLVQQQAQLMAAQMQADLPKIQQQAASMSDMLMAYLPQAQSQSQAMAADIAAHAAANVGKLLPGDPGYVPTIAWYMGANGIPQSVVVSGPVVPSQVYIETYQGSHNYQILPTIPAPIAKGTVTITATVTPGPDGPTVTLSANTDVDLTGVIFRVNYNPAEVAVAEILGQPTKDLLGVQDQGDSVLVAYAHTQPDSYWLQSEQQMSLGQIKFAGSNDLPFSIEVWIVGGSVSFVSKNGVGVAISNCCVTLEPGDTFDITYTSPPTLQPWMRS